MTAVNLDNVFNEVRHESRLKLKECAAFLGVDSSTIRRWRSGTSKPPKSAIEALRMVAGFTPRLSRRGKCFHGWRFAGGMLFTDEGMGFTPAQIRSIWHVDQLLKGQKREIDELNAVLLSLRESLKPVKSNIIPFPVRSGGHAA